MGNCKQSMAQEEQCKGSAVIVDVTKIVKYSCISSVLIVLIVFASNTIKHIVKNR